MQLIKKALVLMLPLLILFPFYFMNGIVSFGLDLSYPDFYNYYPFPATMCNPECVSLPAGFTGNIVYWLVGYYIYFVRAQKNKYNIAEAVIITFAWGILTFIVTYIAMICVGLFFPQHTIPLVIPDLKP